MLIKKYKDFIKENWSNDGIKVRLISNDGELLDTYGVVEEDQGIFDANGIEYPAGLDENGDIYGSIIDTDNSILKVGDESGLAIANFKMGENYKELLKKDNQYTSNHIITKEDAIKLFGLEEDNLAPGETITDIEFNDFLKDIIGKTLSEYAECRWPDNPVKQLKAGISILNNDMNESNHSKDRRIKTKCGKEIYVWYKDGKYEIGINGTSRHNGDILEKDLEDEIKKLKDKFEKNCD